MRSQWVESWFISGPQDATDAPGNAGNHSLSTDSRVGAILLLHQTGPRGWPDTGPSLKLDLHWQSGVSPLRPTNNTTASGPGRSWPTGQPRPYLYVEARSIAVDRIGDVRPRPDGGTIQFGEYRLPEKIHQLRMPWRTLSAAGRDRKSVV